MGRKLVENGQERILQRIFDGVNSNLVLDVSDFKESDNHKLHLVWRKFPRNKCSTEGLKMSISDSTQTNDGSRPDQLKIPKNSFTQVTSSMAASFSDSGSNSDLSVSLADLAAQEGASSDRSFPSAELVARERSSFKLPVKGRTISNSRTSETTSKTELSNRFTCLMDESLANDDTLDESGQKSFLISSGGGQLRGEKS